MNYTIVAGVAALVLLLPASVSEAADHLPSYRFATLYSAAHRLLPDLPKGYPTFREGAGLFAVSESAEFSNADRQGALAGPAPLVAGRGNRTRHVTAVRSGKHVREKP